MPDRNEEELDLTGATSPRGPARPTNSAAAPANEVNQIHSGAPDLSASVAPGQTNDEFVNALLSTPDDKFLKWEECWLPSKGLYYGWPDGMVKVKPMGTQADKILATERLAQSGQSMDYLFREHVKFPLGFDPLDLLLGDRIFLLYFLRGITHGNMYEFAVTCPNKVCGAVSTHAYDLNELASTINWAKPEHGREPFKVVLPYMSAAFKRDVWVGVRFLRASDANSMLAMRKVRNKLVARPGQSVKTRPGKMSDLPGAGGDQRQTQNQQLDDTVNQNLEKIIVSVMGVQDPFSVRALIEKLHAQDTAAIREWLKENTPGIDNTVTVTCPECGHEFTVELPITESFFRPSKS